MASTKNSDAALQELSKMLWADTDNPTFEEEFLEKYDLNYTIDSSQVVMDFIDHIKSISDHEDHLDRIFLRTGAYIGEIIKHASNKSFHWYDTKAAQTLNPKIKAYGDSLGVAAVLYDEETHEMIFPIAKVMKYYEEGSEQNLKFYIQALTKK